MAYLDERVAARPSSGWYRLKPFGLSALARTSAGPPTWLAALVLVALSWPSWSSLVPAGGLDPSWQGGLHMAARDGLVHGRDVYWTYGPLGFLLFPQMWTSATGLAALLYVLALRAMTVGLVFAVARRNIGWPSAAIATWCAAIITPNEMLAVPLAFAVALLLCGGTVDHRSFLAGSTAAGCLVGTQLVVKFSTGPFVALLVGAAVVLAPYPRRLRVRAAIVASAGAAAATAICLAVTSQPLTAFPEMLRGAGPMVSGYSEALGIDDPRLANELPVALILGAVGLALAVAAPSPRPRADRFLRALLWGVVWFAAFRAGFLRHDGGHATQFFGTMAAAIAMLACRPPMRIVSLVVCAVVLLLSVQDLAGDLHRRTNPFANARAAVDQLSTSFDPGERRRLEDLGRRRVIGRVRLAPSTVNSLRRGSMTVYPDELSIAWAYRLTWKPLPVMQAHMAYASELDGADARMIAEHRGPDRIVLRSGKGALGRIPGFDEPRTTVALLCHYAATRTDGDWLVLSRRAVSRCGATIPRGTSTVAAGEAARIPRPLHGDGIIVAKITGVAVHGTERLRSAWLRADERWLKLDGESTSFVPDTVASGIPVSASVGVDFPTPFARAPRARRLTVLSSAATVEWNEVPATVARPGPR